MTAQVRRLQLLYQKLNFQVTQLKKQFSKIWSPPVPKATWTASWRGERKIKPNISPLLQTCQKPSSILKVSVDSVLLWGELSSMPELPSTARALPPRDQWTREICSPVAKGNLNHHWNRPSLLPEFREISHGAFFSHRWAEMELERSSPETSAATQPHKHCHPPPCRSNRLPFLQKPSF